MEFTKTVNNRHSVRSFLDKEIEPEKIEKILNLVNLCPTAGNLQSYRIYLVKKQEIKDEIAKASLNQAFISEAPIVLVFCADQKSGKRGYGERGKNLYSIQDATIAAAYAQLAATDQGLSSVWVGAFEPEKIKSILKTEILPIAIIPLGYPASNKFKRERKSLKDLVIKL